MTKDAKKFLYVLYKEFLSRRKHGESRAQAKNFCSAQSIRDNFFPDWLLDDVEDVLRELDREGYLSNFYADDTVYICSLKDSAIAKLENMPHDIFKNVTDFIAKFIP